MPNDETIIENETEARHAEANTGLRYVLWISFGAAVVALGIAGVVILG